MSFSGEPWGLGTSLAPPELLLTSCPCFLLSRWDSDPQGSRPIGLQTLVEGLRNPELVGRKAALAYLGDWWGHTK